MANSFSNVYVEAVERFYTRLADEAMDWQRFMRIRADEATSLKMHQIRTGGSSAFASWTGGATTATDFTGVAASAATPVAYRKRMEIDYYEAEDNPEALVEGALRMANEMRYHMSGLAWAALAGVGSTSHPVIGSKNIVDTFTSPVSQSNKGTSALSETTLNAARLAVREYTNHDGDVIGGMNHLLVVPAELEATAKELVRSSLSGADNQANTLAAGGDSGIAGVMVAPRLSDANDWFLVDATPGNEFAHFWLRSAPIFNIAQDPTDKHYSLHASYRAVVAYPPECDTSIYGAIVS